MIIEDQIIVAIELLGMKPSQNNHLGVLEMCYPVFHYIRDVLRKHEINETEAIEILTTTQDCFSDQWVGISKKIIEWLEDRIRLNS